MDCHGVGSVTLTGMMGKASKALREFTNDIPDAKLSGIPTNAGTLHKDDNFRLDMQGMRHPCRP